MPILTTVDIQELHECASELIDRVEQGEEITITRHGQPVARIISAAMPAHLRALVAEGTVRPSDSSRYLPSPAKLRSKGESAAHFVTEGRR